MTTNLAYQLQLVRSFVRHLIPLGLLLVLASLLGCGKSSPEAPTYWADVAPIFNDKCVRCHQPGGIAPFSLDGYDDAQEHAALASAAIDDGVMPPFLIDHSGSCGSFQDDETLTEQQKATVRAWVEASTPEGQPRVSTSPPPPRLAEGVDYETPDFAPEAQGGALAAHDEYRCFMLDSTMPGEGYITGYEVTPGNATLVHHALLFLVDPDGAAAGGKTNAEQMAALDAESPDRAGWTCFGAAGEGVSVDAVPVIWAPGQGVVSYPEGVGVRMRPRHKVVVQIHYNLSAPGAAGQHDQTTVRLRVAGAVQREGLFLLPDRFLDTLFDEAPAMLPAGQAATPYTWSLTAEELGLGELPYVDIIGVMPHMHERGRRQELRHASAPSSPGACIAKVPRWDFHWQKMYFYRNAPRMTPSSRIELTCHYDTRGATAPVLPGWGTENEMCLSVLMVALPPR